MPTTIKYIGSNARYYEIAVTGKQGVWLPGQTEQRSDAEAAALLATGMFSGVLQSVLEDSSNDQLIGADGKLASVSGAWNSQASFAVLGDSLSGYNFGALSITSAVRSGGVVTVVSTAHNVVTGGTIALYGANEDTFNVSNQTVTRVDANTLTFAQAGPDQTATGTLAGVDLQKLSQSGYLQWAKILSGNRPQITYIGVQGGGTVSQIASKFVAPAIASGAKNAVVLAGVNNAATSQTAASIASDIITQLVEPLASAGMRVFLGSVWPFNSSHASWATATPKIPVINETLRRYALGRANVVFWDGFAALIDPVNATPGQALTGTMDASNLHPSAKGAYLAGAKLAAAVAAQPIPLTDLLVTSNIDQFGSNSSSNNLLDCGLMQGTGGTLGTLTGTLPTGWAGSTSGTITSAVASIQARADGYGSDMQVVITPGGASAQVYLNTVTGQLLGRVTAGAWYQFGVEITATGVSASNCNNITAYLGINLDGSSYSLGTTNGFTSATASTADLTAVQIVSQPFYVPAGVTVAAPLFYVGTRFSASSASALTIKVGRATFRKLA